MPQPRSLLVLAALLAPLSAQTAWSTVNVTPVPAKRSEIDISPYAKDTVMLFGGRGTAGYLNDTWTFDGKAWTQLSPAAQPPLRGGHCMAYDVVRQRVVVFSGWNGGRYIQDTWEFDGTNWINPAPTTQPPPRDWSAMAYDLSSLRTILFGGHDWQRAAYGDTWAWDGKTWTQLTPANNPPAMTGHRMVFDQNLGGVVLLGNANGTGQLWQWTGNDWKQIRTPTTPGYKWMLAAAFDEERKRLVVYSTPDTWEFDGSDWTRRLTSGGPDIQYAPAFYDKASKRVAVFAGAPGGNRATPTDALMMYGAVNPASYVPYGAGCSGSGGTPQLSGTAPWLGETFSVDVRNLPRSGNAFFYVGLSRTQWGALTLPFDLAPLGAPGCSLLTDPLLLVPMANTGGQASFSAPVPNVASTAGAAFFNQAWAVDPAANALGITVSNGAAGRIGAK